MNCQNARNAKVFDFSPYFLGNFGVFGGSKWLLVAKVQR
jgi:hypothetical protein